MPKAKKTVVSQTELNAYIVAEYRKGRTIKCIAADVSGETVFEDGGGHCPRAMLSKLFTLM